MLTVGEKLLLELAVGQIMVLLNTRKFDRMRMEVEVLVNSRVGELQQSPQLYYSSASNLPFTGTCGSGVERGRKLQAHFEVRSKASGENWVTRL